MVSPGFTFAADALFSTVRPALPIVTFAAFDFEPDISVEVPMAVFGITSPVLPETTLPRNDTEPFTGPAVYPPLTVHVITPPDAVPLL
jgi:hypothetical protein